MQYHSLKDKDQSNGQDNSNKDDSDLQLFDPDFQKAEAQQLISNHPQLKDCEFENQSKINISNTRASFNS